MAINKPVVAEKIFNILKGYGYSVKSFNKRGEIVVDPREGTRFTVSEPNLIVRLDLKNEEISLATGENHDDENLRAMLKDLSNKYLLNFDFRKFNKQVRPKSEKIDIAQSQEKDMADVMEGFGPMSGSAKTSYQPLDNVKIIVRHRKAVNEEIRGARSRNIHSIYIQRGEEKFRMIENNLSAARAMARHLSNGGETFDDVGLSINEMATDLKKLREFLKYVNKANLVNEDNQEFVSLAKENIENIKSTFKKLSGVKSYVSAVESVLDRSSLEILEDDIDLESKFIETHFDNRVSDATDSIKRSLALQNKYQRDIAEAIAKEDFSAIKLALKEDDGLDFTTPQSKLSYQVNQLGNVATNKSLQNHLYGIGNKIATGGSLNQFEYSTIKSCLLSAGEARVKESIKESLDTSINSRYYKFIEKFNIM